MLGTETSTRPSSIPRSIWKRSSKFLWTSRRRIARREKSRHRSHSQNPSITGPSGARRNWASVDGRRKRSSKTMTTPFRPQRGREKVLMHQKLCGVKRASRCCKHVPTGLPKENGRTTSHHATRHIKSVMLSSTLRIPFQRRSKRLNDGDHSWPRVGLIRSCRHHLADGLVGESREIS